MPLYKKKPIIIEAAQIVYGQPLPSGVYLDAFDTLAIDTPEGTMHPDYGDWRIIGVAGEVYSCKDAIFAQTYEPDTQDAEIRTSWRPPSAADLAALSATRQLEGQEAPRG